MHTLMTNLRFQSERFYGLIWKILNDFQLVRFPQLEICPNWHRLTKYTIRQTGDFSGKPVLGS